MNLEVYLPICLIFNDINLSINNIVNQKSLTEFTSSAEPILVLKSINCSFRVYQILSYLLFGSLYLFINPVFFLIFGVLAISFQTHYFCHI
jgi:hypothetical protein